MKESVLTSAVLILATDGMPVLVTNVATAVGHVLTERARAISWYDRSILHPTYKIPAPSVIQHVQAHLYRPLLSVGSRNVFARDRFRCAYCNKKIPNQDLTLDHIIPRCQAYQGLVAPPWTNGQVLVHSWQNLTTACFACNNMKGGRTPWEAGLELTRIPYAPGVAESALILAIRTRRSLPDTWLPHLFPLFSMPTLT